MLTISNITVRLGGKVILDQASASIVLKSHVGLIGRNGAGKSTLMKVIAGEQEADDGHFGTPKGARIGYVAQESPGGPDSPFDRVLAADLERAALLDEEANTQDSHRIGEIHERLNAIEAHAAPARASRILAGLGVNEAAQHQPLDSFSGGWRMRVALAELLFSGPELLLLDEPSNHLDLEAALWLESFLKNYRGTLLVISHERDLLNNVVDHILHLEGGKVTLYSGGYDSFERQRRERLDQVESMRVKQDRQRAHLQSFVDRWRYKAHSARQAQSRIKALARMEPIAAAVEDSSLSFDFPNPPELRPPLIVLDGAAVGYGADDPVLKGLNLRFDPDDRVAFLGRNGNGKTTLARLLSGRLETMAGQMSASGKLRVGYFAQHQVEELYPDDTPLHHMTRLMPDAKPGAVRAQLGRFGFSGEKAMLAVRHLSGGERARLALALITRDAPHMLILDEPTNHLDVDAREALVQALNDYSGAVVIISHDRHLLELTADRLVLIADGKANDFAGSLDDYRDFVLGRSGSNDNASAGERNRPKRSRKDERRLAAEARERTRTLRKAVEKAEKEVNRLNKQRKDIDSALFDPKNYAGPQTNLNVTDLMKKRAAIDAALGKAEAAWLEANEAVEAASSDAA
ncbi:MAG: ABC-F family ATP-binding cassette domain-containing protein [Rhodospirillaceae bacterium]|nr:ABC-F family ATP-binding cassette domain-containing protein [Rhodospirillaceae bacterium]